MKFDKPFVSYSSQVKIIKSTHVDYSTVYRKVLERKNNGQSLKHSLENLWKIRNKPIKKPFGNITNFLEDHLKTPVHVF